MSALSFSDIRTNSTEETSAADRYLAERFKIVARTMILNTIHHSWAWKLILSDLQPKTWEPKEFFHILKKYLHKEEGGRWAHRFIFSKCGATLNIYIYFCWSYLMNLDIYLTLILMLQWKIRKNKTKLHFKHALPPWWYIYYEEYFRFSKMYATKGCQKKITRRFWWVFFFLNNFLKCLKSVSLLSEVSCNMTKNAHDLLSEDVKHPVTCVSIVSIWNQFMLQVLIDTALQQDEHSAYKHCSWIDWTEKMSFYCPRRSGWDCHFLCIKAFFSLKHALNRCTLCNVTNTLSPACYALHAVARIAKRLHIQSGNFSCRVAAAQRGFTPPAVTVCCAFFLFSATPEPSRYHCWAAAMAQRVSEGPVLDLRLNPCFCLDEAVGLFLHHSERLQVELMNKQTETETDERAAHHWSPALTFLSVHGCCY